MSQQDVGAAMSDKGPDPFQVALDLYEQGNVAEAARCVTELLKTSPSRHEVQHLAGDVALKLERPADAVAYYQQAIQRATDNDARGLSWYGLSQAARALGDLHGAENALRNACLYAPRIQQYTLELAQVLSDLGNFEAALEVLRTMSRKRPADPLPYWAIGTLLMQWQRQADALAAFELAKTFDPGNAIVHVFAGSVHQMLGQKQEAIDLYRRALELDKDVTAYCQLAQLKTFTADDADIPNMEARLASAGDAPVEQKIDVAFALGKAYDDLREYDRAFHFLEMGNRFKRESIEYDVKLEREVVHRIEALFTPDFIKRYENLSDSTLQPIFVLGMPRSGTTLVEQMLSAHSAINGGGELTYIGRLAIELGTTWQSRGDIAPGDDAAVASDLSKAAARYAELTVDLHRRYPRFTDKMPQNFLYVGLIHLLFPKARIIHCKRDPIATCFSCFQRRFSLGNYFSFDMNDLGYYYGVYAQMMRHWQRVLPDRMLDVCYEDMVADPETGIRKILAFCDLEFEPSCLQFQDVKRVVATASSAQVRKPIYRSSVEHWRHYERHLVPLIQSLRDAGVQLSANH